MFKVAPPRQGKTIEIIVERDASLVLKAPPAVTIERATRLRRCQTPLGLPQAGRKGCTDRPTSRQEVHRGRRVRLPRPQLPTNPHHRGDRSSS